MEDTTGKVYAWTPMIRMSDMKYPVYFRDFLQEHRNVSQGDWVWETSMSNNFQYFVVRDSEVPEGDVVTEGQPHQEADGRWYRTWEVREFTPEEVADNLANSKEAHKELAYGVFRGDLQSGIKILSGEVIPVEPYGVLNPEYLRTYAASHPENKVLVIRDGFNFKELDAEEAAKQSEEVIDRIGEMQQKLYQYLKTLYETSVIENIPEVPQTFAE